MKGVIHAHSKYSFDSLTRIDRIIDRAVEENLDFIILTDHDTINGSLDLRRRVAEREINLIVPVAAEYKTEHGDIIAVFISDEIDDMNFEKFITEVKRQGGILMLPHPYEAHPVNLIYDIANSMDLVETYNARCTPKQDLKSSKLAVKVNKPEYFGSDSHLESELCNVIVSVDGESSEEGLKNSLLYNKIELVTAEKIYLRNVRFSQFIKATKQRRIGVFYRNGIALIIDTIRNGWNQRVS